MCWRVGGFENAQLLLGLVEDRPGVLGASEQAVDGT